MNLNIGCGTDPWGDIRVDTHHFRNELQHKPKTTVNVLADIQFLPFKDKSFNETRAFHVLEHTLNLHQAFSEMKRVTEKKIVLRCPIWHLYSYLIEVLALFILIFYHPQRIYHQLQQILAWKRRYSGHLWYIRLRKPKPKLKKFFGIPQEYEWTIICGDGKK